MANAERSKIHRRTRAPDPGRPRWANNEVFGTWTVGTLLSGAFGANRQSTSRVTLPRVTDSNRLTVHDNVDLPSALSDDPDAGTIEIPGAPTEFSDDPNEADNVFKLSDLYCRTMLQTHRDLTSGGETVRHTLRVRLRRTNYTRFEAWAYTVAGDTTQGGEGIFGYSNLAPSSIAADNHPRNVEASYSGRTVAVTNEGKLFDGTFTLSVDWDDSVLGGTVESAIRDMRTTPGGARLMIGGTEVSLIAFQDSFESDGVTFSGPMGSKVVYATGAEQSSTDLTTEHSGRFIGESLDGPVAVLGNWKVEVRDFTIDGQFGADVVPAP